MPLCGSGALAVLLGDVEHSHGKWSACDVRSAPSSATFVCRGSVSIHEYVNLSSLYARLCHAPGPHPGCTPRCWVRVPPPSQNFSLCTINPWLGHSIRTPSWAHPAVDGRTAYIVYYQWWVFGCRSAAYGISAAPHRRVGTSTELGGMPHTGWLSFVHPSFSYVYFAGTPLQA